MSHSWYYSGCHIVDIILDVVCHIRCTGIFKLGNAKQSALSKFIPQSRYSSQQVKDAMCLFNTRCLFRSTLTVVGRRRADRERLLGGGAHDVFKSSCVLAHQQSCRLLRTSEEGHFHTWSVIVERAHYSRPVEKFSARRLSLWKISQRYQEY